MAARLAWRSGRCCATGSGKMIAARQCRATSAAASRKAPVLVFDVMDTIVKDPFFKEIPEFFGMTMKELLAAKHPTAWVEFEKGEISEHQLFQKFFLDGRSFDGPGLLQSMVNTYV